MVDTISNLRSNVIQTLSGTIKSLVTDPKDKVVDSFILKDATGEVLVDAEELNLTVGQPVTVVGEFDSNNGDGEAAFEALKITKADGTVVLNPFGTAGAASDDDILDGTNSRDVLDGGLGRDFLNGRGGKDKLSGGDGDDILIGGNGRDVLTGGNGQDTFGYQSLKERGDRITDFEVSEDAIDIDNLLKNSPFDSTKLSNLSQLADFVKLTQVGSRTVVSIDADGSAGSASFKVLATLEGVNATSLSARNFIVG
jgi:Ca2+-binding RTX toxin-like protein